MVQFSSYQLGILVVGVVAFLLGLTSGISFALHVATVGGAALVLCVIAWALVYAMTAGRARRA